MGTRVVDLLVSNAMLAICCGPAWFMQPCRSFLEGTWLRVIGMREHRVMLLNMLICFILLSSS